jgi:hypothetical protein
MDGIGGKSENVVNSFSELDDGNIVEDSELGMDGIGGNPGEKVMLFCATIGCIVLMSEHASKIIPSVSRVNTDNEILLRNNFDL